MLQNCGDSNNPDLWYGVLRGLLTLSTLSGHERLSNVPCAQRRYHKHAAGTKASRHQFPRGTNRTDDQIGGLLLLHGQP